MSNVKIYLMKVSVTIYSWKFYRKFNQDRDDNKNFIEG